VAGIVAGSDSTEAIASHAVAPDTLHHSAHEGAIVDLAFTASGMVQPHHMGFF